MENKIENVKQDKKNNKKKLVIALLLLLFALAASIGIVAAYFSDMIQQSNDLSAGTLKITGDYTFFVNGIAVPSGDISNLNPGDIVVIKASIQNEGNKSAWIRNAVTFTTLDAEILPYLKVYEGEFNQINAEAETYLLTLTDGTAVSGNWVIDGYGDDAETEGGGGYDYLGASNYDFAITIYFDSAATNEAQGKSFNLNIKTQALQFRNNNATEPNKTAWNAVTAVI